jgi:hypothetical protein
MVMSDERMVVPACMACSVPLFPVFELLEALGSMAVVAAGE